LNENKSLKDTNEKLKDITKLINSKMGEDKEVWIDSSRSITKFE
jgi:hypothetical protein